jgi:Lrp/AsnC family transcriptional regulator
MRKLDKSEKDILRLLQEDSSLPLTTIAKRVNLSPTPCWRRIQKLRAEGILRKEVALVNPEKVNAGVNVFVSIRVGQHNVTWLKEFRNAIQALPQVVEFYRMSGDVDLLLRIVVPDIKSYDAIYQQLMKIARALTTHPGLFDVSSNFALEQVKYTTALPLDYA